MVNPIEKVFKSKLNIAIFLLSILILLGIIGFKIISGFSWIDSIYMTIITITTVGFGEVQPLDSQSKLFTIGLILTSAVTVGYALKVITEYLISKNDINELKQKKMQKTIDNLSGHIIICGYGRNGKQAAKKLKAHNRNFVIIEKSEQIIQKIKDDNLNRTHVSNLKHWKDPIAAEYNVRSIPELFLIDDRGAVLARSHDLASIKSILQNAMADL